MSDHDPTVLLTSATDKDEWRTPPELYAALDMEFKFTLDPCATERNALASKFHTKESDGLAHSWRNERVFMNPPYRRGVLKDWVRKAAAESSSGPILTRALVVGLLPATRTEQPWWHEYVLRPRAEIRWLRGRLVYVLPDGSSRSAASFPSVIVIWRP